MSKEVNDIKKILVKLPRNNNDVFSSFPFLVTLSEEFPKAEINIIVEDNGSTALGYLPFKIKVFERPANKMSLIETHHYCANMNDIFNIDLFFDLENSLNSAFMGFNFIHTERLPLNGSSQRRVPAFAKSGMHLGLFNDINTMISERADKGYATQVYVKGTFGATRTEEGKVVEIVCAE